MYNSSEGAVLETANRLDVIQGVGAKAETKRMVEKARIAGASIILDVNRENETEDRFYVPSLVL
jgi:hypothetical protein